MRFFFSMVLWPSFSLLIFAAPTPAATVTVCDETSLRAAVQAGGTILFGCDGTIVLSQPLVASSSLTLDAAGHDVTLSGNSQVRILEVRSNNLVVLKNLKLVDGRDQGTTNSNDTSRDGRGGAIWIRQATVQLIGCRLDRNSAVGFHTTSGVAGAGLGGAICLEGGTLLATNCQFNGNLAQGGTAIASSDFDFRSAGPAFGGALYIWEGHLEMSGCRLLGNAAKAGHPGNYSRNSSFGGGLCLMGGIHSIDTTTVERNQAQGVDIAQVNTTGQSPAFGGGIYQSNAVTSIRRSFFNTNQALGGTGLRLGRSGSGRGGGICQLEGALRLESTSLIGNEAISGQGGRNDRGSVAQGGAVYSLGELEMNRSTMALNHALGGKGSHFSVVYLQTSGGAAQGAGLFQDFSTPARLLNCSFIQNHAQGGDTDTSSYPVDGGAAMGGAIFISAVSSRWTNLTFLSNSVIGGVHPYSGNRAPQIGSSIFTSNNPCTLYNTILAYGVGAPNVDVSVDGTNNLASDNTVFSIPSGNLSNTDPLLGPFRFNGGPTPTVAPLPGSPAIDAGSDLVCPLVDQRGQPRPQGAHCDIGAVESAGIPLAGAPPSASRLPDGRVHFEFQGEPDRVYTIQSSINLVSWFPVGSTSGDEEGTVVYETQPSGSFRFYRVLPNP